jgi:uncharacterized GH25 family protein
MKKMSILLMLSAVSILLYSGTCFAHYASVTVDNSNPAPGKEITVNIGVGHTFPADGEMKREDYNKTRLQVIDSKGQVKAITVQPEAEKGNKPIVLKLTDPGAYTIVLSQKGFATKTAQGYKSLPKNQVENAIHSSWSETVSKTFVNVGPVQQVLDDKGSQNKFQIIPLENPLKIAKDGLLPVKVTLDGKPWKGMVFATYENFSDMSDTFAYATPTDKEGIARIKILKNGLWLIKADHTYPYENTAEADEYSLKATLTFKN